MQRPRAAIYPILLASLLGLFLLGFFLGEDALGGGIRSDLYTFHGPTIFAFHDHPWRTVLPDYNSATTPLFHILESVNPTLGNDAAFRASNLLIALLTIVLFAFATLRRFPAPQDRYPILLIAGSILLSPYYRAESYWASTDILPILFVALTAILLIPTQDETAQTLNPYLLIPLAAIISWAAFYTRQTYLFLPAYACILLLVRFKREHAAPGIALSLIVFGALALPAAWLVHLWHGLTPPHLAHHEKLSPNGIVAPLSMIFIYAIPFLIEAALATRGRTTSIPVRKFIPWLLAAWLLFLAIFHSWRFDETNRGGGIAAKFLSHLGTPGAFLFLTTGFLGLLVLAWLWRASGWRTRLLLVLFLIPDFAMSEFYQRYFDPLLVVLLFLFLDRTLVRPFVRIRMAALLLGFNGVLLAGALLYNVHSTRPEFLPLTSDRHPWTHTDLDGKVH